jgi:hypothetical protein
MSAHAAVFSAFRPKEEKGTTEQSVEVAFLDVGSWVSDVFSALTELESLTANWDSYGSPPPQAPALRTARRFLARVPVVGIPAPRVSPVAGGGIGFHWRVVDRDLEIEFFPNGGAEFLKSVGDDETSSQEGPLDTLQDNRELWKWLAGF